MRNAVKTTERFGLNDLKFLTTRSLALCAGLSIIALLVVLGGGKNSTGNPYSLVLLCGAGLGLLAGWLTLCTRRPVAALSLIIVVAMLQGLVKQVFNWTVPVYVALDVPWLLFLAVWAVKRLIERPRNSWSLVDAMLLVFIAWSLIQIENPGLPSKAMAIAAFRARLLPLLFFWVGKDIVRPEIFRKFLFLIACVVGVASIFGIYEWLVGSAGVHAWGPGFIPKSSQEWVGADNDHVLRPFSIYQDGILAATFTGVMVVVLLGDINIWPGKFRKFIFAILISAGIFIALSGVRTAILLVFFASVTAWAYHGRRALPGISAAFVAICLFSLIGWNKMEERYVKVLNPINAYSTERGTTVTIASSFALDHPLGTGTGSATNSSEVYAKIFDGGKVEKAPFFDNGFGVIVAEGGFPLLLLYLVLLITVLKLSWRQRSMPPQIALMAQTVFCFTVCVLIWSAAAAPLDYQPLNILYWLFLGSYLSARFPATRSSHDMMTSTH